MSIRSGIARTLLLSIPYTMVVPMFTLTLPFPFLRFTLRVELERLTRRRPTSTPPPLSRSALRERFRNSLSPHLLRDVGLDDSCR